jgi:hypothetical protein
LVGGDHAALLGLSFGTYGHVVMPLMRAAGCGGWHCLLVGEYYRFCTRRLVVRYFVGVLFIGGRGVRGSSWNPPSPRRANAVGKTDLVVVAVQGAPIRLGLLEYAFRVSRALRQRHASPFHLLLH